MNGLITVRKREAQVIHDPAPVNNQPLTLQTSGQTHQHETAQKQPQQRDVF